MIRKRILALGAGQGWHANSLREASTSLGCDFEVGDYASLTASFLRGERDIHSDAGALSDFDVILTRTMPASSFERITVRLAMLHEIHDQNSVGSFSEGEDRRLPRVVNPPRSLELAIDKYATLSRVAGLGYSVPETVVTQTREEAFDAFKMLGGDCVIKPVFGGEGRGIMRVTDTELAWYVLSTLDRVDSVFYVQQFKPPGGIDYRLLVIGDEVFGIRRANPDDFRANVASGGECTWLKVAEDHRSMALKISRELGLRYGAVDFLELEGGVPCVIEVNAIPGWKGAQKVAPFSIASRIISSLLSSIDARE